MFGHSAGNVQVRLKTSSKWSISVELKESTEVALSLVGWTRADDLKSSVNMVQYGLEHYTVETGSYL